MSATPPDSRPDTPVLRPPRRQVEDESRKQDKKYRRYATAIERALASFDPSDFEWPDYISFLGRLLKTLQSHPPDIDILPHKSLVANRLSQCLKPTLPSGVHQKALEVYAFIFGLIGEQSLGRDLSIYLPGLSGVLGFASLSLRPAFLALVEDNITPLDGIELRPALRALILALLPGLEEESGEDFERTMVIIDKLKARVNDKVRGNDISSGDEYFWQCFFIACIAGPSRRLGALAYLSKRLPSLKSTARSSNVESAPSEEGTSINDEELPAAAEACVSPEPGLLMRYFASGLEDDQLLTQRGFLDLLLSHLPLDSPVLANRAPKEDVIRLVTAATSVVARREMSLNRRLWSWFLGPESDSQSKDADELDSPELAAKSSVRSTKASGYFERHGSAALTDSISLMLAHRPIEPQQRARPFRICLSLMDRGEVGGKIVPRIFMSAIINVFEYQSTSSRDDFKDVLRSASSFFDGVESGVIWSQLANLAVGAITANTDRERKKKIELANFIMQNFNVREEDMVRLYAPCLIGLLLGLAGRYESGRISSSSVTEVEDPLQHVYGLIETLLGMSRGGELAQPDIDGAGMSDVSPVQLHENRNLLQSMVTSYLDAIDNFAVLCSQAPLHRLCLETVRQGTALFVRALGTRSLQHSILPRASIISSLLSSVSLPEDYDFLEVARALQGPLQSSELTETSSSAITFPTVHAIANVVLILVTLGDDQSWQASETFINLVNTLVQRLWTYLSPSHPRYHLEAVRCIWQVEELLGVDNSVGAAIASLFANARSQPSQSAIIEHARRFAVLWTHTTPVQGPSGKRPSMFRTRTPFAGSLLPMSSAAPDLQERLFRPLLLLLDLAEDNAELDDFLRTWLERLPNASRVYQILVERIRMSSASISKLLEKQGQADVVPSVSHGDKRSECLYYLQKLLILIRSGSDHLWSSMREDYSQHQTSHDEDEEETMLAVLVKTCFNILGMFASRFISLQDVDQSLQLASLAVLQLCFAGLAASSLQGSRFEVALIAMLRQQVRISATSPAVQAGLLDTTLAALKATTLRAPKLDRRKGHRRVSSTETLRIPSSVTAQRDAGVLSAAETVPLDPKLANELTLALQEGLRSSSSVYILEHWVQFMVEVLPLLSSTLFQSIIPLVETLCDRIRHAFQGLNASFTAQAEIQPTSPEPGLVALLNGLQYLLVIAHERLSAEEVKTARARTPEPSQGFFGNVVSGVFAGETPKTRSLSANTRLTVILCFQDALRVCLSIWTWGAYGGFHDTPDLTCLASYAYVSQRLRNQTRRLLDRMFLVEGLECLETLIVAWTQQNTSTERKGTSPTISLLHVLDSSNPKQTMPALFNSIYSRTSPSSIDTNRLSTLTSDITDVELAQFLIDYTKSLDDDAMDEIWVDCMTFLRDILTNPAPHNHILPLLLQVLVILAEKVDKTNFGEQRKMRKELGDLFLRLLTATFITHTTGFQPDSAVSSGSSTPAISDSAKGRSAKRKPRNVDLLSVLADMIPRMSVILPDNDRLLAAITAISTNITAPLIHAKAFPDNLRLDHFIILRHLTSISAASKVWRKDLSDLLMHPRLFNTHSTLIPSLLPLFKTLLKSDPTRLNDLSTRINAPTSAGMIFGVGATAARTAEDKKTQLHLRRMGLLILAAEPDTAVPFLSSIDEKITDLLAATPASSPSSTTRAEIFLLYRALLLSTTADHLTPLYPTLTTELTRAISSALPRSGTDYETYNVPSLLQACKLLDVLVLLQPEGFQLHEWLFITDSTEAVYRAGVGQGSDIALVDEVAEELASATIGEPISAVTSPVEDQLEASSLNAATAADTLSTDTSSATTTAPTQALPSQHTSKMKTTLLPSTLPLSPINTTKPVFTSKVLRPFFAGLSIHAYENLYSMASPDIEGCKRDLWGCLFDESTIVG